MQNIFDFVKIWVRKDHVKSNPKALNCWIQISIYICDTFSLKDCITIWRNWYWLPGIISDSPVSQTGWFLYICLEYRGALFWRMFFSRHKSSPLSFPLASHGYSYTLSSFNVFFSFLLKEQWHKILDALFHDSNPSGPLFTRSSIFVYCFDFAEIFACARTQLRHQGVFQKVE